MATVLERKDADLDTESELEQAFWGRGKQPYFIPLEPSHIDELLQIERASFTNPWSRELLLRELQRDGALKPGICLDRRLVAYSFNYLVLDELHILSIGVDPQYRSCGLGKMLLTHILAQAVSRGATYATLEVRVSNTIAQRLYAALNFHLAGMRKHYYQDNGEDAFVLERQLIPEDYQEMSKWLDIRRRRTIPLI